MRDPLTKANRSELSASRTANADRAGRAADPACRAGQGTRSRPAGGTYEARWGVFVECQSEDRQRELLERLTQDGYDCRGLMG